MDEKINYKALIVYILISISLGYFCYMFGASSVHNDSGTDAQIRAINERIERIDRDIKLEFGSLRSTISEGRGETEESRRIVVEEREARQRDREIIREMQDRITELQAIGREIKRTEQEIKTGK